MFLTHAMRRLAVVRGDRFVGMLSVDDLLVDLAGDLAALLTSPHALVRQQLGTRGFVLDGSMRP